jgi:hypothetical protein
MSPKFTKTQIILAEIIIGALVVSGFIQSGFPTNTIFWIATVVEIGLGYLTYAVFKQYLSKRNYKYYNYVILLLTIIGIGLPLTLYYTVNALKTAGGTWLIYLLTVNSFYFYRVIKKEPMTRSDIPPISQKRLLSITKVTCSITLILISIMIIIGIVLPLLKHLTVVSGDEDALLFSIMFVLICSPILFIGLGFRRIVRKFHKNEWSDMFVYYIHTMRISFFFVIAVLGLILSVFIGVWYIGLVLIIIAGLAIALTFPTTKRWEYWKTARRSL